MKDKLKWMVMGAFLPIAIGAGVWGSWVLWRFRRAAALPSWSDPDYAVPCLGPDVPHAYVMVTGVNACGRCGGGRLHPIHPVAMGVKVIPDEQAAAPAQLKAEVVFHAGADAEQPGGGRPAPENQF